MTRVDPTQKFRELSEKQKQDVVGSFLGQTEHAAFTVFYAHYLEASNDPQYNAA